MAALHPGGEMRRGFLSFAVAVVLVLAGIVVPASYALPAQEAQEAQDAEEAPQGPRPMTVDDALDLVSVGSPMISPDGNWVFYSERKLDWGENESNTKYYLAPADGGENPSLGSGFARAGYTREEYTNGIRISLDIYIRSIGGNAGVGTGGYEVYLPDDIRPGKDIYSGHASLWLAGGGISEFDGSVKWTMRNQTKGPKLIFTFNGREWTANDPKPYNDFKLRANIRYFL